MNLIVDIGNSLAKCALMEQGRVVAECRGEVLTAAVLDELLAGRSGGALRAIVSSTRGAVPEAVALVRSRVPRTLEFTAATPVPIGNAYRTPETLGRDRLAAAVGVARLYPRRNVLIVDCGTALTIDLLRADGVFCGGCISPGLWMRMQALHDHTAALPCCSSESAEALCPEEQAEEALLGLTTEEAIVRGAVQAICFEIEGYAARLRKKFDDLCVIFTGGEAKYFVKRIKNTIFANQNPVFCGLDTILDYNVREEYLD